MEVSVGTKFRKDFGRPGIFSGEVVTSYPPEKPGSPDLFGVRYEDGDEEDLTRDELVALLATNPKAANASQIRSKAASTKKRGASSVGGEAPKAAGKRAKSVSGSKKSSWGGSDADECLGGGVVEAMARAEAKARALREAARPAKKRKTSNGGAGPGSQRGGGEGVSEWIGDGSWEGLEPPTREQVTEALLAMGNTWPTQVRPNVSDKAVQGMCLGMVNALTAGLRVSLASRRCPEVTKLVVAFCLATLPEASPAFKFSSVQINYNYAAKRHVDGNNMGPSYITSLGQHSGGELWTADMGIIDPKDKWCKFNGKLEHETQPFEGTRISFILFTHNACEELTSDVVADLQALGFTAGDTCRQRDPGNVDESDFDAFFAKHRTEHPPPVGVGMVAVECAGYACGRGAAWVSYDTGPLPAKIYKAPKKRGEEVAQASARALCYLEEAADKKAGTGKPSAAARKAAVLGIAQSNAEASRSFAVGEGGGEGVVVQSFPKNRVGLHVVELKLKLKAKAQQEGLELVATRRFDLYNRAEATAEFAAWVDQLPVGHVVCIAISDTAIAKKRPMEETVYDALRKLGAPAPDTPVVGYRNPFVFLGAKGLPPGQAQFLLDKRAQSKTVLRVDARIISAANEKPKGGAGQGVVITEVKNSSISARDQCPYREKEGWVFKNCTAVKR